MVEQLLSAAPDEYKIINRDGSYPTEQPLPIGQGASSVVYRAVHREKLRRAIKVLVPRDDPEDAAGQFAKNFETEVATLAELSHENIAKITDFGSIVLAVGGPAYPYIVTEFIEGIPLDEYWRDSESSGQDILAVLQQVLSAMTFMHKHRVMHSDLKPANIIVRSGAKGADGVPAAVILDLGVSQRIVDLNESSEFLDEYTRFFCTPRFTLDALVNVAANHSGNRIRRRHLAEYFPWQDLHSFGVILEEIINNDVASSKLELVTGRAGLDALTHMRSRLRNPQERAAKYSSASEVRAALERLGVRSVAPLTIPELASVPESGVVVPTNRTRVPLSIRTDAIVSHPLFQRLHQIPQLDLLRFVLVGATQSRLVHALHTHELTRQAISRQLGDWRFRLDVEPDDIVATLMQSLLDSVGRYHFQHMFEDFLRDRKSDGVRAAGLLHDGELLDRFLATTPGAKDYVHLRETTDVFGRTLGEIVEASTGMEWSEIRKMQTSPTSPVKGFLAGLLSSPADTDKIAYLADDSDFTGLPFGSAVAPQQIFEGLRVPDDREWWALAAPRVAVALREKTLSHVEQAVLSRYWNIQTGYWYRTNRSLQAMVKFLIGSLIKAKRFKFSEYISQTLHLSQDGALRWLDSQFHAAIEAGTIDQDTIDPIEDLLESRREIYKRLVTISPRSRLPSREQDKFIYEALSRRSSLDDNVVCREAAAVIEQVKPGLKVRPGEVLLDLPRVRREETGGKILVYADNPGAAFLGELSTISPVLTNLHDAFDLYAKRLRILVHPRIERALGDDLERAHLEVLEMLRGEYGHGA